MFQHHQKKFFFHRERNNKNQKMLLYYHKLYRKLLIGASWSICDMVQNHVFKQSCSK